MGGVMGGDGSFSGRAVGQLAPWSWLPVVNQPIGTGILVSRRGVHLGSVSVETPGRWIASVRLRTGVVVSSVHGSAGKARWVVESAARYVGLGLEAVAP